MKADLAQFGPISCGI